MLPLLLSGLLLLAFASFGAAIPGMGQAQPNRFVAPAFLCVALAAAYCVGAAIPWLRSAAGRYLKIGLLLAVGALLLYAGRETLREATPGPHGHYGPSVAELGGEPPVVAELVDWLRANTTAQGRVAFETSLGRVHGGGHVAGLVALKSGRELIGAGYPFSLPEVSFWDRSAAMACFSSFECAATQPTLYSSSPCHSCSGVTSPMGRPKALRSQNDTSGSENG